MLVNVTQIAGTTRQKTVAQIIIIIFIIIEKEND